MQHIMVRGLMTLTVMVGAAVLEPAPATAQQAGLEGAWSGGGSVRFPSGETERARCRANFSRRGSGSFSMSAVCATASLRVQQTALVAQTGPNRYVGNFVNDEYGISGSIQITLKGKSLNASLAGGGGSATMSMSR